MTKLTTGLPEVLGLSLSLRTSLLMVCCDVRDILSRRGYCTYGMYISVMSRSLR